MMDGTPKPKVDDMNEADLSAINMFDANLRHSVLRGSDLRGVDLRDIKYDEWTLWPEGIGPTDTGPLSDAR